MGNWNSLANRRRALWVLLAVPVWAAAGMAGLFVGVVVEDTLRQFVGYVQPPLPVDGQSFGEFILEFGSLLVGIFGPLGTLVAAAGWRWSWRRTAAATLVVGLVAAAVSLVAGLHPKRFSFFVIFAHVGLFCGMAGGMLAWLRARTERRLAEATPDAGGDE